MSENIWPEEVREIFRDRRSYSKKHRKEFVETYFLELLGEGVLEGIARRQPKAFEAARAILDHLESKINLEGE